MGNNAYKRKHIEQGLCTDCSRPAIPGQRRCMIHYLKLRESVSKWNKEHHSRLIELRRKWKQIYRDTNRCTSCGAPLGEQDEGHVKCVNCRDRKVKAIPRRQILTEKYFEDYYKKIASQS